MYVLIQNCKNQYFVSVSVIFFNKKSVDKIAFDLKTFINTKRNN